MELKLLALSITSEVASGSVTLGKLVGKGRGCMDSKGGSVGAMLLGVFCTRALTHDYFAIGYVFVPAGPAAVRMLPCEPFPTEKNPCLRSTACYNQLMIVVLST
jgi:hypothetical protein